jgi:drug/metabolite transporter (DMT)-like permease
MSGPELPVAGILGLVVGSICWSGGSVFGKQLERPSSPLMGSALQMICGGAALTLVAVLRGEPASVRWGEVSSHSLMAWAYLVVFGSWMGFGSFVWLMEHVAAAKVATYAYVNPAIAVLLGWLLMNEPVTWRTVGAMAVILVGVAIVQWPRAKNGWTR